MFEIKEVSKVEATGNALAGLLVLGSAAITTWGWAVLLPAAIAC